MPSVAQITQTFDAERTPVGAMGQTPISESPVLPVEILQPILQAAARSDHGCAYSLALVARTVHIW